MMMRPTWARVHSIMEWNQLNMVDQSWYVLCLVTDQQFKFHFQCNLLLVIPWQIFCGEFVKRKLEDVQCFPEPDPFNPCEDVLGNVFLRVVGSCVALTTVLGNLVVLVVLLTSHLPLSVSRFLIINLAVADLCMGIYYACIVGRDLTAQGNYFNHALDWQEGMSEIGDRFEFY